MVILPFPFRFVCSVLHLGHIMSRTNVSVITSPSPDPFESAMTLAPLVSTAEAVEEMRSQSGHVPVNKRPLHRLAEARKSQDVSLTRVARRLAVDIAEARRQETETTDLLLSQLYRWREILEVPVGDLILEPDEIPSNPIKSRSQMIKMMKTVRAIMETSKEVGVVVLAKMLFEQLTEMMPELSSIAAWPSVGQSREQRDLGQAAYRRFDPNVSRFLEE